MSRRERDRMTIMVEIKRKELTLVEASQVMDLSYRQTRRVWRRYQTDGDAGLVHRLRGQPRPLCDAKRRNCASVCWRATTNATGTSARRWRRSIWKPTG